MNLLGWLGRKEPAVEASSWTNDWPHPRIARGVMLLDEFCPGWDGLIDLEKLDIADGVNCVVAQVFGDYSKGLNALLGHGFHPDQEAKAGFAALCSSEGRHLTALWKQEILKRRAKRLGAEVQRRIVAEEWKRRA